MMEKEKKLFDAITDIPDHMIEEAGNITSRGKNQSWKRWTALAACAALAVGTAVFGLHGGASGGSSAAIIEVVFPKAYAFDDYDTWRAVREANPVTEEFLAAVEDFTWRTASEFLSDNNTNVNYSPLSLYYALSLAASGAEGQTAKELYDMLGVENKEQLSAQCGNLYRLLYSDNEIGKLKIANSLWLGDTVDFKNSYVENAAKNFYAASYQVDYADSNTGKLMSKWIADNSNGMLQPEITLDDQAIMTILNTVYFKDQWIDCFQVSETAKDTFYLSDGSTVECDFMNRRVASGSFTRGEGFTSAGLSLKNAGSMVFILPDEDITPQELLAEPEKVQEIFETEENGYGEILWQVPKFDFVSEFDMAEGLKNLGIQEAFEETADFSGITEDMAYISKLKQETHIAIDENGVEASAFTMIAYAGAGMPEDKAEMILNRPFIYGIRANNGTLLFIGVCGNPS